MFLDLVSIPGAAEFDPPADVTHADTMGDDMPMVGGEGVDLDEAKRACPNQGFPPVWKKAESIII